MNSISKTMTVQDFWFLLRLDRGWKYAVEQNNVSYGKGRW